MCAPICKINWSWETRSRQATATKADCSIAPYTVSPGGAVAGLGHAGRTLGGAAAGIDLGAARRIRPQCGDHETLRSNEATFRRSIVDTNPIPHDMLDSLSDWLAGRGPINIVESFNASGPPGSCRLR